jgi:glycosyltransferase involved in cell wall biosynthesis
MLSFIVPAYNEEHELPRALASIRRAAEAAQQPFEIIVVDDGSTDATAEIAKRAGALVLPVQFRQIAAVRNAGARAAHGDVLFFVDADTWISPTHVADALSALKAGCAGGGARVVAAGPVPLWGRIFVQIFSAFYFTLSNLGAGAFLFTTRENFRAVGGFDDELFAGEEVYFTVALKKLGRFKLLREPIVTSGRKLRMHSAGFILKRSFSLILGGKRGVRSREKLDLWYDGKRETKAAAPVPVRAMNNTIVAVVAIASILTLSMGAVAKGSEENQGGHDHRLETGAGGSQKSGGKNAHDSASIGKLIDDINTAVRSNKQRMLSIITINTDVATSQLEREKAETGMTFGDVYVAHSLALATKKKFSAMVALHKAGKSWADIAKSHNVTLRGSSDLIEQMKRQP